MMLDKDPSPRQRRMAPRAAEILEDRVLLSGNVAAMISHDSLIIKGDSQNNQLEIAMEERNLVVRGLEGTTINGKDSFVALKDTARIPKNLVARLGKGDDTLLVQPGVEIGRKLKIVDRDGAATIGVQDALIGGSFVLRTGKSADSVSIAGTHIGRNAVLVSGRGDDLISISETTIAKSLRISTRQGDDDLVLQKTDSGKNARIRTGSGNDDVVIEQSTVDRHLIVGTWLGDDFLMFEQTTVGRHTHLRLPAHLPREECHHELSDEDCGCPCCGETRVEVGSETSEQLEFISASVKVIRHVRVKYACRRCAEHMVVSDD